PHALVVDPWQYVGSVRIAGPCGDRGARTGRSMAAAGRKIALLQLVRKVVEQQVVGLMQVAPSHEIHAADATPTGEQYTRAMAAPASATSINRVVTQ
ncbi:MAG: hypothetical protein LC799_31730, partial [Actinobacteria bacterium]|nr:hypothetical protein [Actinomycetota bacterium]